MTKPWDADGEKPGSPTSMDILVRWLRTPAKITSEINKHAAKRSPEAVRRKIYNLEQQFKNVTTWLRRKGQLVAYTDSAASEATKQGVLQRCPRYCELATVFQTKNAGSEADTKHGDEATDAMDNELPIAQGDQKRNPDALDENQRLKKQRKQEASEPIAARSGAETTGVANEMCDDTLPTQTTDRGVSEEDVDNMIQK
ncbi:hypothetical protein GQ600_26476 [Phytophthora cactorum]|nr:hypothetical protein GQ600_26476 [Phytophthora cactorum]